MTDPQPERSTRRTCQLCMTSYRAPMSQIETWWAEHYAAHQRAAYTLATDHLDATKYWQTRQATAELPNQRDAAATLADYYHSGADYYVRQGRLAGRLGDGS